MRSVAPAAVLGSGGGGLGGGLEAGGLPGLLAGWQQMSAEGGVILDNRTTTHLSSDQDMSTSGRRPEALRSIHLAFPGEAAPRGTWDTVRKSLSPVGGIGKNQTIDTVSAACLSSSSPCCQFCPRNRVGLGSLVACRCSPFLSESLSLCRLLTGLFLAAQGRECPRAGQGNRAALPVPSIMFVEGSTTPSRSGRQPMSRGIAGSRQTTGET